METPRPSVFIGSSKEGFDVAEAIQLNLDYVCEATVWSQGVFGLSQGTLESLVEKLDNFDFAILVVTPDDVITSRDTTSPSPRDNVLLELGMFIGAIGRQRTFIVSDRAKSIKLPSDLAGITPATYQLHSDGNLSASLGAVTTQIKSALNGLGRRISKITADIDQGTQFQIIHDLLDNSLEQFIILMHDTNQSIRRESPMKFGAGISYEYQMRNFSAGRGVFSIGQLCEKLPDADLLRVDLRNNVSLTERGSDFAQWLIENGHKADYFTTSIGNWGNRSDSPLWDVNRK